MSRTIAALVVVGIAFGVGRAYGQESNAAPAFIEVTYMPAGAAYFTSEGDADSFGNYGFGTAVTFNINRYVGIEGELGALIATTSDLQFGDLDNDTKAPNFLNYTANVVVSPGSGNSFAPYAAGGVGGSRCSSGPALV